jgi:16S rRNA (cytosine967-C5)-methyltransferase
LGGSRRADRPDARTEALRILRRVEEGGAYASVLLEAAPEPREPRDRGLLQELVLGVLRRRTILDHVLGQAASRPTEAMDPPVRSVLRIGAYSLLFLERIPDFAAVDASVELARKTRLRSSLGFINGVLRQVARRRHELLPPPPTRGDVEGLALWASHPPWWVNRLVERLGWDAAVHLLEANNRPAPTVLRVHTGRTTAEVLAERLRFEGVETEAGRVAPGALRVVRGSAVRTVAFREGLAWVQDEAAQLVPMLFGPDQVQRAADLCAAPGGKTMQLATGVAASGWVVAADRHPGRLRRLAATARRLGLVNVLPVAADLTAPAPWKGTFARVLVDAPCSGTGTLRRHPEIRWRIRPGHLADLRARQQRILDSAAGQVEPGGRLVYAVCSIEPEEGEEVAASFLDKHAGFEAEDPRPWLPENARACVADDGALRTLPGQDHMDGFVGFVLRRVR